jgi:hypothetical protein
MLHTQWQQDLTNDLSVHDGEQENNGMVHPWGGCTWEEFTQDNRNALKENFLKVRDNCQAIVEIGVCRNGGNSSTHILLDNKLPETIYVGIDIEDKSFLNNPEKNIYTIKNDSSDFDANWAQMQAWGVKEFGFIFIDGWHSINQVKRDWEYSRYLSTNGIVGFHDTTCHPGPKQFVHALDTSKWQVVENVCPQDWGIGFAQKR